jgi:hypothetical protein
MQAYKNLGGDSNVEAYKCQSDSITIKFMSGKDQFYLYNHIRPGAVHVEQMKALAAAGQGLNSYVSRNLRLPTSYARKW